jgi:hypothetical protein
MHRMRFLLALHVSRSAGWWSIVSSRGWWTRCLSLWPPVRPPTGMTEQKTRWHYYPPHHLMPQRRIAMAAVVRVYATDMRYSFRLWVRILFVLLHCSYCSIACIVPMLLLFASCQKRNNFTEMRLIWDYKSTKKQPWLFVVLFVCDFCGTSCCTYRTVSYYDHIVGFIVSIMRKSKRYVLFSLYLIVASRFDWMLSPLANSCSPLPCRRLEVVLCRVLYSICMRPSSPQYFVGFNPAQERSLLVLRTGAYIHLVKEVEMCVASTHSHAATCRFCKCR